MTLSCVPDGIALDNSSVPASPDLSTYTSALSAVQLTPFTTELNATSYELINNITQQATSLVDCTPAATTASWGSACTGLTLGAV
jgi:hypothetical protein